MRENKIKQLRPSIRTARQSLLFLVFFFLSEHLCVFATSVRLRDRQRQFAGKHPNRRRGGRKERTEDWQGETPNVPPSPPLLTRTHTFSVDVNSNCLQGCICSPSFFFLGERKYGGKRCLCVCVWGKSRGMMHNRVSEDVPSRETIFSCSRFSLRGRSAFEKKKRKRDQ